MKGSRKHADTVGNLAAPKDDGGTGIEPTSGAEARSSCPIYGTTEVVPFPISLCARTLNQGLRPGLECGRALCAFSYGFRSVGRVLRRLRLAGRCVRWS
jgi:hypothetical protein